MQAIKIIESRASKATTHKDFRNLRLYLERLNVTVAEWSPCSDVIDRWELSRFGFITAF